MVPLLIMGGASRNTVTQIATKSSGWAHSRRTYRFGSATVDVSEGPANAEITVTKPQRLTGRVQLGQPSGTNEKPAGLSVAT
jgi:hypothetical protein